MRDPGDVTMSQPSRWYHGVRQPERGGDATRGGLAYNQGEVGDSDNLLSLGPVMDLLSFFRYSSQSPNINLNLMKYVYVLPKRMYVKMFPMYDCKTYVKRGSLRYLF